MSTSVGDILDASIIEHLQFGTNVRLPDGTRALLELLCISREKERVISFQRETSRGDLIPVVVILIDNDPTLKRPRVVVSMLPEHFDIAERWRAAKERWPIGMEAAAKIRVATTGRIFVDLNEEFLGVIRREENAGSFDGLTRWLEEHSSPAWPRRVEVEVIGHDDIQAEIMLGYRGPAETATSGEKEAELS